uniref:Uncharacterized protein n=1 Tax=Rhizophora mucronata TaxID=61149 RepID=A0A2P2J6N6_RHIMU
MFHVQFLLSPLKIELNTELCQLSLHFESL